MPELSGEKWTFTKGTFFSAGLALSAWFVLNFLTDHLEWFGSGAGYRAIAFFLYLLLGLSISFSGPVVYGVMFFHGASLKERILGAYLVPVAWVIKEVWRVSDFFTLGEALYYSLSPWPLGVLTHQIGYLSLVEILCRWREKKRDGLTSVLSLGPIVGLGVFALMVYLTFFWGFPADFPGTKWFYLYQEGYKVLFGMAGHG